MSFTNFLSFTLSLRAAVGPLDVDNLFLATEGSYNGLQAYKNSKLANILFTFELNRQLQGSGVKVNALCPGKTFAALLLLTDVSSLPMHSYYTCRIVVS